MYGPTPLGQVAEGSLGLPAGPHHAVIVRHDSGEQRDTITGVHGQKRCSVGTGYPSSQLRELAFVSDGAVDPAVLALPDTLDEALGRECSEDGSDVGGQVRPHGQAGAGSETAEGATSWQPCCSRICPQINSTASRPH
ncbi:hypothetical protein U9R90_15400 [Streptomyces sp. E11-3]|uniref:hypothetical protein n=1 Tax=Streptomyces sp. E11-3 TaxID=3110112 RepID=UPI003980E69D